MTDDLVRRLRDTSNMIALGDRIQWGLDSHLMDAAADRIEALEAENARLREDRGVAVKPLAWDEWDGGMTIAKTPVGNYTLSDSYKLTLPTGSYRQFEAEAEAKADAQVHHRARVLSALERAEGIEVKPEMIHLTPDQVAKMEEIHTRGPHITEAVQTALDMAANKVAIWWEDDIRAIRVEDVMKKMEGEP